MKHIVIVVIDYIEAVTRLQESMKRLFLKIEELRTVMPIVEIGPDIDEYQVYVYQCADGPRCRPDQKPSSYG